MYSDIDNFVKSAVIDDFSPYVTKLGYKELKRSSSSIHFTRNGKTTGNSATAKYNNRGVATIFNFTTNGNIEFKDKGYNLFDFIKIHYFNGNVKDTCNYLGIGNNTSYSKPVIKAYQPEKKEEKPIQFNYDLLYRSNDDYDEERLSIQSESNKHSRTTIDNDFFANKPDSMKNRMFRIAVNPYWLNKEVNPIYKTKISSIDLPKLYSQGFHNILCTYDEIIHFIVKGYAIIFSELKEIPISEFSNITSQKPMILPKPQDPIFYFGIDNNYRTYRSKDFIVKSELFGLDIDNDKLDKEVLTLDDVMNIELTSKALFIYTSSNHQIEKEKAERKGKQDRYRIVFDLPGTIDNYDDYTKIVSKFIKTYNADESPKDFSRLWFGNNNATIYDFIQGEIINYKNGIINE